MKEIKQLRNKRGLNFRLIRSLLLSGAVCAAVYFVLYFSIGEALSFYFNHSDFEKRQLEKQVESLQTYIDKETISSNDLNKLEKWEKRQPLIFLELYHHNRCIYASPQQAIDQVEIDFLEETGTESPVLYPIKLQDIETQALLYSDFFYRYYMLGTIFSFVAAVVLFIFLFLRSVKHMIQYICRLKDDMQIIEGGDLDHEVTIHGNDELTDLAESMNNMRISFREQMEQEQKIYQTNRRMITQMSHDLRTPLTGLMLYTDIARYHKYESDDELQECLTKIDQKAQHIKRRTDHIFEYALSNSDNKEEKSAMCETAFLPWIERLMEEPQDSGFALDRALRWDAVQVRINQEYLERIGDNIVSNIIKYADPDQAVFIKTIYEDRECGFLFANDCKHNDRPDSHGVGIESIHELMERMGGYCQVHQTMDRFEITLLFPCYSR